MMLPMTCNNIQEGVQTDPACNIQQRWKLLAISIESVCTARLLSHLVHTIILEQGKDVGHSENLHLSIVFQAMMPFFKWILFLFLNVHCGSLD